MVALRTHWHMAVALFRQVGKSPGSFSRRVVAPTFSRKDENMPRALHAAFTRAHCQKGVSLSPLTCYFVRHTAQLHGISDSEFIRRVLDFTMNEYIGRGLFTIPERFYTFPEPEVRKPTPSKWEAVRNLKQYRHTPNGS